MNVFQQFTKSAIIQSTKVMGEPASVGGNSFLAMFDDSAMEVARYGYGDSDEITTTMVCCKADLSNKPAIGETLTRINKSSTYVILTVDEDVGSYTLTLRQKNG